MIVSKYILFITRLEQRTKEGTTHFTKMVRKTTFHSESSR